MCFQFLKKKKTNYWCFFFINLHKLGNNSEILIIFLTIIIFYLTIIMNYYEYIQHTLYSEKVFFYYDVFNTSIYFYYKQNKIYLYIKA